MGKMTSGFTFGSAFMAVQLSIALCRQINLVKPSYWRVSRRRHSLPRRAIRDVLDFTFAQMIRPTSQIHATEISRR